MSIFKDLKIKSKHLKYLDFSILITVLLISIYSLINIYSVTHSTYHFSIAIKQLIWIIICIVLTYFILTVDYTLIANYAFIFYIINIGLILFTLFIGKEINGSKSWIILGPVNIEPGEFLKITLNLLIAKKLHEKEGQINNIKNILIILIYSAIPILLVIKQSDLGVAILISSIVIGIVFISGINLRVFVMGFIAIIVIAIVAWNLNILQPYQKSRITSFINQNDDQSGKGMQLQQSKIGIGSGGIIGQGFLKGKQVNKGIVPEQSTDLIFSALGEEWGLVGATVLLLLYAFLIFRVIRISRLAKDLLGSFFCVGVVCELLFSVLQNIGMTIGIMPITGITLPFMSYGGSSILTNSIAIAIVLNIGMRRRKIEFQA